MHSWSRLCMILMTTGSAWFPLQLALQSLYASLCSWVIMLLLQLVRHAVGWAICLLFLQLFVQSLFMLPCSWLCSYVAFVTDLPLQ
jgi:hypothetical protein